MNIFDDISLRALKIVSNKSDGLGIYSHKSLTIQVYIVIDKDTERSPGDLFSGAPERITAIDMDVTVISDPQIGATITTSTGDAYIIDDVIENDGTIARVSVKNG